MDKKLQLTMKSTPKYHKSTRMDQFSNFDDYKPKLVIPIGPRFQADVPEWAGPLLEEPGSSKWLGTMIWSMKDTSPEIQECVIGKGRPDSCSCTIPGSSLCVKRHVSEETTRLQMVLGPAFQKWKFDQMGEAVANSWKQPDQQTLTHLMQSNQSSKGRDFIRRTLERFPLKSKKDILNFYFNVYIPRRMSMQTRSGCVMVNVDDDGDGDGDGDSDDDDKLKRLSKGCRKKARVDYVNAYSSKLVTVRYLNGGR